MTALKTSHHRIHEHDFIRFNAKNEVCIICSTCGLSYCERSGKLTYVRNNMKIATNDPSYLINIQSNVTRKHCHESALNTAAHILICLTQERKSIEQIAREDFDNNLELVSVWVDYMIGINWIHSNTGIDSKNPWIATYNGKNWVEKIFSVC